MNVLDILSHTDWFQWIPLAPTRESGCARCEHRGNRGVLRTMNFVMFIFNHLFICHHVNMEFFYLCTFAIIWIWISFLCLFQSLTPWAKRAWIALRLHLSPQPWPWQKTRRWALVHYKWSIIFNHVLFMIKCFYNIFFRLIIISSPRWCDESCSWCIGRRPAAQDEERTQGIHFILTL